MRVRHSSGDERGARRFSAAVALLAATAAACQPDAPPTADESVVAVKVSPENPVVQVGAAFAFSAIAYQVNGEGRDVTDDPATDWDSTDADVLQVNADGSAEAKAEGEAYVTASVGTLTSPAQKVTVEAIPTTPPPTPTPTPAPSASHVVISEVMYDPATSEPTTEYVELHNPTGSTVSIAGWKINTKNDTAGSGFTFGPGYTIPAGGYLVLANHKASFDGSYSPAVATTGGMPSMTNTGEWIVLKEADGDVVDHVIYEAGYSGGTVPPEWCATPGSPSGTSSTGNPSKGISRKPVDRDGDNCNDWVNNTPATPGAVN